MVKQSESVAHAELVAGEDTTRHSHPGGGNGADVKSGQSTGAKAATVQVNFTTAFAGIPRVSLTPWSPHIVNLVEVTTTYFKWTNDSKNVDVTVDWIATDAANP